MMKSLKVPAALLLAFGLMAAACGGGGGSSVGSYELVAADTLTVCTDSPYPPMEFEDDEGNFTGFDIELMRAIGDEIGLDVAIVNSGFDPITSGLAMEAGDCDIAAASITINAEREENIDFSNGYFSGDQSLLAKVDSGINALADLSGKNLGVQSGTTGALYAEANNPGATVVGFENPGDLITALNAGEVSAVLQDIVVNGDAALNNDDLALIEIYSTDEFYGFAVKEEGAEDLLAEVNDALEKVRASGKYQEIFDEFFPTS
jgi:polar amino acid transport system substrate-binding protein